MAFGRTMMLDMYNCKPNVLNDLGLHYDFLEQLVHMLSMNIMAGPYVCRAPAIFTPNSATTKFAVPSYSRIEKFPSKEGISGWVGLVESGCQIHSLEPSHFSTLDIYTCGSLDNTMQRNAVDLARSFFDFKDYESYYIERGAKYLLGDNI